MPLEIATRPVADATVVAVTGDLDVQTADELRDALSAVGSGGTVVLDLGGVDFLDSSALGVLVGVNKRATAPDGRFVIVCAKPHLLRVFEITRLGEVLSIMPTLDDALA